MGTRGTCGIIVEDELKLGYNQFDSYPEGLGIEVLDFISKINSKNGWNKFIENAKKVKHLLKEDIDVHLIEMYKEYSDLSVSEQTYYDPYCLLRKLQGASWLFEVYNGKLKHYNFNNDFILDSLFCEYGYIINLDRMCLEVYNGFQKVPQKNNIFGENKHDDYYPSKLVGVIPLEVIRSNNEKDIVSDMYKMCEEDGNSFNREAEKYLKDRIKLIRKDKLERVI